MKLDFYKPTILKAHPPISGIIQPLHRRLVTSSEKVRIDNDRLGEVGIGKERLG